MDLDNSIDDKEEEKFRQAMLEVIYNDASTSQASLVAKRLTYADRIVAYRDGYPARVYDALTECFEYLAAILEDDFYQLAEDYAQAVWPSHYDLARICRDLPAFMATHPVVRYYPSLVALAEFEWALSQAFHAATLPEYSLQDFSNDLARDGENYVLHFQASVQLLRSSHRVGAILLGIKEGRWSFEDIKPKDGQPDELVGVTSYLIYRQGFTPSFIELSNLATADFIALLMEGQTLGKVCDQFEDCEEIEIDAVLPMLARLGLLCAVDSD